MNIVLLSFLFHFLADWVLQSPQMGREKSSKFKVLCQHIGIIYFVLCFGMVYFIGWKEATILASINALTHAVIDWNIWRLYRVTVWARNRSTPVSELQKNYKYWLDPVFGYFLGVDQLLHYVILYYLYGVGI